MKQECTPSTGGTPEACAESPYAGLTERQVQVLDFIGSWTQLRGVPPTLTEVARALKVSRIRVLQVVTRLRELGLVMPSEGHVSARTLRLTGAAAPEVRGATVPVPVREK